MPKYTDMDYSFILLWEVGKWTTNIVRTMSVIV